VTALAYWGYAAGSFALIGLVFYYHYHRKAADGLKARQAPMNPSGRE
jgi:hypothetical protein